MYTRVLHMYIYIYILHILYVIGPLHVALCHVILPIMSAVTVGSSSCALLSVEACNLHLVVRWCVVAQPGFAMYVCSSEPYHFVYFHG